MIRCLYKEQSVSCKIIIGLHKVSRVLHKIARVLYKMEGAWIKMESVQFKMMAGECHMRYKSDQMLKYNQLL